MNSVFHRIAGLLPVVALIAVLIYGVGRLRQIIDEGSSMGEGES